MPEPTAAPDPRPVSMRRRVDFDTTPETDTTAPVTADLRERIISVIKSVRIHPKLDSAVTAMIMAGAGFHITDDEAAPLADALLAALAGDPGDLPARMAAEVARHHVVDEHTDWSCVCGAQPEDWNAHLGEAALSVRWEHAAHLAARLEHALAELSSLRDHRARWEVEHERAEKARILAGLRGDLLHEARQKLDRAQRAGREAEGDVERLKRTIAAVPHAANAAALADAWAQRDAALDRAEVAGVELAEAKAELAVLKAGVRATCAAHRTAQEFGHRRKVVLLSDVARLLNAPGNSDGGQ